RIELRGLELVGVVGLLPEERTRAQPLVVDVDVEVDLTSAGLSDDLSDSVDYGAVCDRLAEVVESLRPQLLERLAAAMAAAVLDVDPSVVAVTVAVRKARPPVPHLLATSGVRIRRTRSSTSIAPGQV
ncbi:MAG: dihydroneopterin aldolase, partial [Actinobacteria bacterium]|nr:dihydroneopterin aldolase [Actinomycetota bacterium]